MAKNKKIIDFGEVAPKQKKSRFQKLLNFFRIAPNGENKIIPTEPEKTKNGKETGKYNPINMPTTIDQAYKYFVANMNTGIYRANEYRLDRYKDCKYACTTEPLLNTSVQIYVSEAYSPENGKKPIEIHAKNKKVESEFYTWMANVGFTDSVIRSCLWNLVVYGDAFWVNKITDSGVEAITPLDPFLVANRIEFNVGMVEEMKKWNQFCLNISNTYGSLKDIYDIITGDELEDISQFYRSYLFGYELKLSANTENEKDVKGVPPWAITHCRMFTTETDFFPFGKPILLNSIPAFKSYRTTQMLIDMLRVATFPREHITIKGEDAMDPFTRMQRVDEVRQFLENITPTSDADDLSAVGQRIYSLEDLFDVDLIDSDIDLDKLGDLEYKKNDMIMSTGIPDAYLNPSEGAGDLGGENAESLKYLNKIFSRRCEQLRESLMEGITETFRMHLMLKGIGDGDKEEFELSMPNNVEDMNSDEIDKVSDTFTLAKDIIDTISSCAGLERGETVDQEIVKDIMKTYLPVSASTISKWISKIYKDAEEQEAEMEDNNGEEGTDEPIIGDSNVLPKTPKRESRKENIKKLQESLNNGTFNARYLEIKKNRGITDGNLGNMTYFNNSYRLNDKYSSINLLKEQINQDNIKRIKEEVDKK